MSAERSMLTSAEFNTPLGPMRAIADENVLYVLEFIDRPNLKREIERLTQHTQSTIIIGRTRPLNAIKNELHEYFGGKLREFKTPVMSLGTTFQEHVWQTLKTVPFGTTRSYADIAMAISRPSACRAVARANSTNKLAIIVPCHRVINANGKLGGYADGLWRKEWLINHENQRLC